MKETFDGKPYPTPVAEAFLERRGLITQQMGTFQRQAPFLLALHLKDSIVQALSVAVTTGQKTAPQASPYFHHLDATQSSSTVRPLSHRKMTVDCTNFPTAVRQ